MLSILRRHTPITTSPAPPPAAGLDVPPSPQRPALGAEREVAHPAPAGEPGPAVAVPPQLSTPAAHPSLPTSPPSYRPGICYHDVHVHHGGQRIGVLILPDGRASWLPCEHHSRDGR